MLQSIAESVIVLGVLNVTEHLGQKVQYIDSFWTKQQFMHHQLNHLSEVLGVEPLGVEFCTGLKGQFITRQSRQGVGNSIALTFPVEDLTSNLGQTLMNFIKRRFGDIANQYR